MTNLLELKSIAVERGRDDQARFSYQLTGKGIVSSTTAITGTIEIIVPWKGDLATAQKEFHDHLPSFHIGL